MTPPMTRPLGRSDIQISALGLGCWAIGGPFTGADGTPSGWGEVDDDESIRAIHRGLELGVTFFDTANIYGTGHSERVLARALAGSKRDGVTIATKFGNTFDEATHAGKGHNAAPESIREQLEGSLRRLNTDVIDLYQFHINSYAPDNAPAVRDLMESLVREGKIRYYGWSTDFPDRARIFAQGAHCVAIQVQLNVLDDNPQIVAICEEFNLAAINRGPLAMGLLTGKYTPDTGLGENDVRGTRSPQWMKYFRDGAPNPEWLGKLEGIRDILTSNGRTLAQGALAWLWARSPQTIPIPGFRTVAQVEENARAMEFGPLAPDQIRDIDVLLGREPQATA